VVSSLAEDPAFNNQMDVFVDRCQRECRHFFFTRIDLGEAAAQAIFKDRVFAEAMEGSSGNAAGEQAQNID